MAGGRRANRMVAADNKAAVRLRKGGNHGRGGQDTPAVAPSSQPSPIACAVDSARDRRVVHLARDRHLGRRALF